MIDLKGVNVAVLAAVVSQTVSILFLIFGIRDTQYTLNLPYESLLLCMVASLIMFGIAFQRKYYVFLTIYLIQFLLLSYVLMSKLDLERRL